MPINPGYFLSEATTSFRRNWVMSFGAIITIFLSLLLVGSSLLMNKIISNMAEDVESKVNIQIWIRDDASQQDIDTLQRMLATNDMVKTVQHISKDQAWERFKKQTKESPEIVQQLKGNPLPASLDVELKDARNVESVVAAIKASPEFPKIANPADRPDMALKYGQDIVKTLFNFTKIVRYVGIVLVAMLALVSLIFINNTIRLAIYARRSELSIMRLVGASNGFIRAPFIFEGVLQALVGATFAIFVLVSLHAFVFPKVQNMITFMSFGVSNAFMGQISLILIASAIAIGAIGAILAMRKYLRV